MKKDLTSVTCIAATGGDRLPLPEIGGDYSAFAALRSDGSVVTWGSRQFGGQTASVQEKLENVTAIQALRQDSGGFVAVRADGKIVHWGVPFEIMS